MNKRQYRDLIRRASRSMDAALLDHIALQLADAERTREILQAKGYGKRWMRSCDVAALVPVKNEAKQPEASHRSVQHISPKG